MGELTDLEVAKSRRARRRGLLGRDELLPGHALLIPRCRSVHTFRMRFPIAVVFLNAELRVLGHIVAPPGRLVLPRRATRHILECRPQDAPRLGLQLRVAGPG